jgi:hypothetical protein
MVLLKIAVVGSGPGCGWMMKSVVRKYDIQCKDDLKMNVTFLVEGPRNHVYEDDDPISQRNL